MAAFEEFMIDVSPKAVAYLRSARSAEETLCCGLIAGTQHEKCPQQSNIVKRKIEHSTDPTDDKHNTILKLTIERHVNNIRVISTRSVSWVAEDHIYIRNDSSSKGKGFILQWCSNQEPVSYYIELKDEEEGLLLDIQFSILPIVTLRDIPRNKKITLLVRACEYLTRPMDVILRVGRLWDTRNRIKIHREAYIANNRQLPGSSAATPALRPRRRRRPMLKAFI